MWKNKKILITGGLGMIGRELIYQLRELGADVTIADMKKIEDGVILGVHHLVGDLRNNIGCKGICEGKDYVFHLAGIKGNPKMTNERPVDFMGPMLQFDTNMILAAQEAGVKRFLYTSSIAVENPESDKYPAWAKMTGETLIKAMKIQHPEINYCVVRPANVYGRFDNFEREDNMVITSLIKKAMKDGKLVMDIKGSKQIRDFINAKDIARGMIKAMEELPDKPVNLCSGKGVSIEFVSDIIANELNIPVEYKELNLTLGPDKKVMKNPYIKPEVSLEEGIKEAINYVKENS